MSSRDVRRVHHTNTGMKDERGRTVYRGEHGELFTRRILDNKKIAAAKEAGRAKGEERRRRTFENMISLAEVPKKHAYRIGGKEYDPETLDTWLDMGGKVPHTRQDVDPEERKAIKRAVHLKHGHEGWRPVHEMFNVHEKASAHLSFGLTEATKLLRELSAHFDHPSPPPGWTRGGDGYEVMYHKKFSMPGVTGTFQTTVQWFEEDSGGPAHDEDNDEDPEYWSVFVTHHMPDGREELVFQFEPASGAQDPEWIDGPEAWPRPVRLAFAAELKRFFHKWDPRMTVKMWAHDDYSYFV